MNRLTINMYMLMRCEEGREKDANKVIQNKKAKQHNTSKITVMIWYQRGCATADYTVSAYICTCITKHSSQHMYTYIHTCRLMRRRIKVADPRIFLISAAYMYMHIREEVVDEYQTIT